MLLSYGYNHTVQIQKFVCLTMAVAYSWWLYFLLKILFLKNALLFYIIAQFNRSEQMKISHKSHFTSFVNNQRFEL